MWSYYGGKGNVADCYPRPKLDTIIEPFAGSARYSLRYFEKDVILYDKYSVITSVWRYLQQCSQADVMAMPLLKIGDKITEEMFDTIEQFWFMGFLISGSAFMPARTASKWGVRKFHERKSKIARNIWKVKHWSILDGSYDDIPNQNATWFIDPPYQNGGHKYVHSNKEIDFNHLGSWSRSRTGQVIVCENSKADWMDFKPMKSQRGIKTVTTESIWSNQPTAYDNLQTKLIL